MSFAFKNESQRKRQARWREAHRAELNAKRRARYREKVLGLPRGSLLYRKEDLANALRGGEIAHMHLPTVVIQAT